MPQTKKPKLCYVIPSYAEYDTTHFSHVYDFIEELAKRFDIYLIIERGELPKRDFECQRIEKLWFHWLPLRLCELHCRFIKARLFGYKNIYVHYSFLAAFAASAAIRPLGGTVWYWNCGEPWKYRRSKIRSWFERLVYKTVSYVVTGTDGLAKKYAEVYKIPLAKIKVMPNWINLERFKKDALGGDELRQKLGIGKDTKIILFAHRLSQRKGAQYIPEIAEKIKDANAVIIVAGDGPERQNQEAIIKNQELEEKVRFVGAVANREIPRYYSMADVFIMPSDEEGFPRVILEAMAIGVPFAAFDVGGIKEFIPQELQKYIVQAGNADLFAQTLKALLAFSELEKQSLRKLASALAQKYDISKVIDIFESMIMNYASGIKKHK